MLIMLVPALLCACSAVKLGYNQAPSLGYWWIDGYLDLNEQQSPKVRDALTRLLAWHRSSELPKVIGLLQKAQTLMPGEISAAQSCALYGEAKDLFEAIVDYALPTAAAIAPTLSTEQLAHLRRKQQKMNDEYTRDYLRVSATQRLAKRLKMTIERSEMLYGKLSDAQTTSLEAMLQASIFNPTIGLKERERRHQQSREMLAKMVRDKPAPTTALAALRAYANDSINSPDPIYRTHAQQVVHETCTTFATLHASTSTEQRTRAAQTLKDYENDMRVLALQK
jgi:hypothetical protein